MATTKEMPEKTAPEAHTWHVDSSMVGILPSCAHSDECSESRTPGQPSPPASDLAAKPWFKYLAPSAVLTCFCSSRSRPDCSGRGTGRPRGNQKGRTSLSPRREDLRRVCMALHIVKGQSKPARPFWLVVAVGRIRGGRWVASAAVDQVFKRDKNGRDLQVRMMNS